MTLGGMVLGALLGSLGATLGQTESLGIAPSADGQGHELKWQSRVPRWTGSPMAMRYQAYESTDLKNWSPLGPSQQGSDGEALTLSLDATQTNSYYRLESKPEFLYHDKNSGTVVSYGDQRDFHFDELQDLTIDGFEQRYAPVQPYRQNISWDVTKAQFWDAFATSHVEHNAGRPANDPDRRLFDFRLNDREVAMMKANGFVVTSRHQRNTFVDLFYDIWTDDLPVYFSTDAALQAWHRSYQTMLAELEEIFLQTKLEEMLASMRATFPAVWEAHGEGPLRQGLRDADFFLTVASSLIGTRDPLEIEKITARQSPHLTDSEQRQKVTAWLDRIDKHEDLYRGGPFGNTSRLTDFSQFTVRGNYENYENSAALASYFRAMTWLGQIDLRMAGGNREMGTLRQLSGAVCLALLLRESEQEACWQEIENIIAMFVGLSDAMTPPQMLGLLESQQLDTFASFDQESDLSDLQVHLLAGAYGKQEILGAPIENCGEEELVLPRSFTFFGQRFSPDSWSLAEVTYDRLPFPRRLPMSLDVAFATFDNRAVVPLLASNMRNSQGLPFRDGYAYQPYLAAAHATLQSQEPAFWQSNMYQHWLGSLRALSPPTTGQPFPEAMQTEAWAMKNLNTQLASWTQLRHDTVLYVKQSVTPPFLCFYPAGYVEPRVAFWEALEAMSRQASTLIGELSVSGAVEVVRGRPNELGLPPFESRLLDTSGSQAQMMAHFDNFADVASQLAEISRTELAQEPFTEDQQRFIESLVEGFSDYVGVRTYSGWYPNLYYNSAYVQFVTDKHPSDVWDPLIVDVHTDGPSVCHGDPGAILHEAVGNVDFMMLGVNHDDSGCVYAGPVFSYYEMVEPYPTRHTDSVWKARVEAGDLPPRPSWTSSFLAE